MPIRRLSPIPPLLALLLLMSASHVQAATPVGLTGVACPSTSLCVAVDEAGNVLTSTNPDGGEAAWSTPVGIDGGHRLEAIACPSVSLCVAVDNAGNAIVSTDPTGGAAAWTAARIDPALEPSNLQPVRQAVVACPSTALCVVVDEANDFITSTNPTGGAGAWTLSHITGSVLYVERGTVACASAALCVTSSDGAEEAQWIFSATEPTGGWEAWKASGKDELPEFRGVISGACPSEALCVLGDGEGNILTSTTPATGPWSGDYLEGNYEFAIEGMSCPSTTLCVAADRNGDILTSTNPTGGRAAWQTAEIPDGYETAVACPTISFCAVVNHQGNVWTSTEPAGSVLSWHVAHIDNGAEAPIEEEPKPKEEHPEILKPSCCDPPPCCHKGPNPVALGLEIEALLNRELVPSGRAVSIGALLRHGGLTMPVSALTAGTLRVQWLTVPSGAKAARKAKPVLVASGQTVFAQAGSGRLKLRLTKAGRRVLRGKRRVSLAVKGVFEIAGQTAVSVTTGIRLRR